MVVRWEGTQAGFGTVQKEKSLKNCKSFKIKTSLPKLIGVNLIENVASTGLVGGWKPELILGTTV